MKSTLLTEVAVLCLAYTVAAPAKPPAIVLDTEWQDTDGHEILAQGGCVVQQGNMFYMYGVEYDGQRPRQVRCYRSADLVTWKSAGPVLAERVSRRVKVLAQRDEKRLAMFLREGTKLAVLTSAAPTGPFSWLGTAELPDASGAGDVSAFLDEDGRAYLVYNAGAGGPSGKDAILCAELKPGWSGAARVVHEFKNVSSDSPSLWKHKGVYYCTAAENKGPWYAAAGVVYTSAPQLTGPWRPWRPFSMAPAAGGNSRHNMVFDVQGSKDHLLIYWGDRYSQWTQYGVGKQVWLPVFFRDETPYLVWCRPWYPDAPQGTFTHDLRRYGLWRDPPK